MTGYRDLDQDGPHAVRLGGVELVFGADGTLWNPSAAQLAVMTEPRRSGRFLEVEQIVSKSPIDREPVAGRAFEEAVNHTTKDDD